MVLHLLILSGEEEDFVRELVIDGDSTFLDLHNAIQKSVKFDSGQLASFFVSDDEWSKNEEITLMQMDEDEAVLLMGQVKISEYIDSVKDKLIYTFDYFSNRGFFVEVLDVAEDKNLEVATVVRAEGVVPLQIELDDPFEFQEEEIFDFDEEDDIMSGYGDDEFDEFDGFNEFNDFDEY